MSEKQGKRRCSGSCYAKGAPKDAIGWPCEAQGVVERLGKWWCRRHDPEKRKAPTPTKEHAPSLTLEQVKELIRLAEVGLRHEAKDVELRDDVLEALEEKIHSLFPYAIPVYRPCMSVVVSHPDEGVISGMIRKALEGMEVDE